MKITVSCLFLLAACTDVDDDGGQDVDCEILEDARCDTGSECPSGYACSGLPAFWCYRGEECILPECLPPNSKIATPSGPVAVSELTLGHVVWTRDEAGRRVSAPVLELTSRVVSSDHRMLRIVLEDGRVIRGSGGHPTVDGRPFSTLTPGQHLDGSPIRAVTSEPYAPSRTFDLLPAGPTGVYQADGVWIGSTLGPRRGVVAELSGGPAR